MDRHRHRRGTLLVPQRSTIQTKKGQRGEIKRIHFVCLWSRRFSSVSLFLVDDSSVFEVILLLFVIVLLCGCFMSFGHCLASLDCLFVSLCGRFVSVIVTFLLVKTEVAPFELRPLGLFSNPSMV